MFLDKTTEQEFFASLESNLKEQYSFEDNLRGDQATNVLTHLAAAVSALARAGLVKEAECVATIADKATKGLTSEQMVKHLAEIGWVFPAPDKHNVDSCMAADCMQCSEGGQSQLSQTELKRLREILNR